MKRKKAIIYYDIRAEERNLRRLFPKPKKGQKISCSSFDYEYNIRRRAIFNTYCRRKYTLQNLNYRLNNLNRRKDATLQVVLSVCLGVFSGVIVQIILDWLQIYPEWERLFIQMLLKMEFGTLFRLIYLTVIVFATISLTVVIIIALSKNYAITVLSDHYHLEDYEKNIIEAQLLMLESNSTREWRSQFKANTN